MTDATCSQLADPRLEHALRALGTVLWEIPANRGASDAPSPGQHGAPPGGFMTDQEDDEAPARRG